MTRRLLAATLALLLPVAVARADEAADGFAPEDHALLPITERMRDLLLRDHADLVTRLTLLGQRAERVGGHLKQRTDPQDDGTKRLLEELTRIRGQFAPLTAQVREILVGYGMEPDAFERVRAAPKGPLREERYAHALVLAAPDVGPEARAVFERAVPAVDGALLVLHAQRAQAVKAGGDGVPALEARSKEVERRFWRAVDVLLDAPARRWIHRRLPGRMTQLADGIGHLYRVTGLTPSQGAQIKTLLVELDSEAAADGAEVKRAETRLQEGGVPDAERAELERVKTEATRRLLDLRIAAYARGKAILTEAQFQELEAVPPEVTTGDRLRHPKEIVDEIEMSPGQGAALGELARRYEGEKKTVELQALAVQRRQQEYGPDSPQQDMMMMEYVGIQNRVQAVIAQAAREIFTKVLTPDQIVAWVLGVPK